MNLKIIVQLNLRRWVLRAVLEVIWVINLKIRLIAKPIHTEPYYSSIAPVFHHLLLMLIVLYSRHHIHEAFFSNFK